MSEIPPPTSSPKSDPPRSKNKKKTGRSDKPTGSSLTFYVMLGVVVLAVLASIYQNESRGVDLPFGEFFAGVEDGTYTPDNVFELTISPGYIAFVDQPRAGSRKPVSGGSSEAEVPAADQAPSPAEGTGETKAVRRFMVPIVGLTDESISELTTLLREKKIPVNGSRPATEWLSVLSSLLLILMLVFLFVVVFRRMGAGAAMSFGRSRGRLMSDDDVKVTFDDVAGIDEAAEELREVVEFLRTPGKYQALGGRIPRGVLLVGPPGTGKTMLAKAVAGEAGVPFFSLSGSDFVEMFVGVGAARVRDMFAQAAQRAPSIIFIDELDALGKMRGSGLPGGQEEREQTLNALLVEMDGFSSDQSVIVMGATNRPETLDPALMRPVDSIGMCSSTGPTTRGARRSSRSMRRRSSSTTT